MYNIGALQQRADYQTLREAIVEFASAPFKSLRKNVATEQLWALKDVSFEVNHGEVVGIIGRNGAGKSTLLKILSRITKPTSGRADIYGRVGSLLEVGTGFHPEMTGRENIYMNGAILGMARREIDRKFDEIVAFSEIEKFLDTPVKRYSSGMYIRLAFAVAAHLEPEILVVDEVLAVGDIEFQKKCLGKMNDVSKSGRTVLFVSHNMAAIQRLCERSIWLEQGGVMKMGDTSSVLQAYLNKLGSESDDGYIGDLPRSGSFGQKARLTECFTLNEQKQKTNLFKFGESVSVAIGIVSFEDLSNLSISLGVDSNLDYRLTTVLSEEEGMFFQAGQNEKKQITVTMPGLRLKPGRYFLIPGLRQNKRPLDMVNKATFFDVADITTDDKMQEQHVRGDLFIDTQWSVQ